ILTCDNYHNSYKLVPVEGSTASTRMRSRRISKRVLAFLVGIAGSGLVPSIPTTGPTSYGRSWAVGGEGR
ncbi:hypothetical protein AVEN_51503-1, partial [Araneus ventricosus]